MRVQGLDFQRVCDLFTLSMYTEPFMDPYRFSWNLQ